MEQQKNNWFQNLSDKINSLSEQFALDELQTLTLRDFVISTAKTQYRIGNKSGAGWAFAQSRKGFTQNPASA